MSLVDSHATNTLDLPLLQQLDKHLQQLTLCQKTALAMLALYESTEVENVFFSYQLEGFGLLTQSVELILCLSNSGKLAVARTIAEELAVLEQYGSVKGQAELRMRKEGASTRPLVPRGTGFLEGNFDSRFLTTLGLLL